MSLKRKREISDDNNDLGSPKKKQKSIDTSSPCSEHSNSSRNHNNMPSINRPDITMDGDDENSDIDIDLQKNTEFQATNTTKKTEECALKDNINELKVEDTDNTTNQLIITPTKHLQTISIAQSLCHSTDVSSSNTSPVICDIQPQHPLQRRDINGGSNKVKQRKQRRKCVKNNGFWKEIDKLDLIIPPPDDDLCDRHLIIIHTHPQDEEKEKETESKDEENDYATDIHGLDSTDSSDIEYEWNVLPNCSLNDSCLNLLKSMNSNQYRIVKIANYALSIKSEYFRNLLSRTSSFAECSSPFVVVRVSVYDAFCVELLLRLLHIDQHDIKQYLCRIENHETLIQLLVLCDQYQVKHVSNYILQRLKFIAFRERPKPYIKHISKYNYYNANGDAESDKENNDTQLTQRGRRRRRLFLNKRNGNKETNQEFIRHILPRFDATFDNGGMSLDSISYLLLISDTFECLHSMKEIAMNALKARYTEMQFDKCGIVDIAFRKLPSVAVNAILNGNELCSWTENDVFLACAQWAAFPLHNDDKDALLYSMNTEDNGDAIVLRRFNQISPNIRYHLLDAWFIECIVKEFKPIVIGGNTHTLINILNVAIKASLVSPQSPRNDEINKYLLRQKPIRAIPRKDNNNNNNNNNNDNVYLNNNNNNNNMHMSLRSLVYRNLSVEDRYRRTSEYSTFIVVYNRRELVRLSVGERLTSSFMVWNGVVFALDLVRKENVNNGDSGSVGVFLYSQGLECVNHIWIKYSLRTLNHEHLLQCSDYKMMNLNFQKGNGSRDFFGCSWHHFLNTYFDANQQIKFKLTFIDAK